MIGGVLILLVAIWFYQSAIKAEKPNSFMWAAIGAVTFFAVQYMLVNLNVYILEAVKDTQSGGLLPGRDIASIGDRVTQDTRGGTSGFLLSVFFELMPPIGGVVVAGLIRCLAMLGIPPTPGNIFGGFGEMISGIVSSMKSSVKKT